MSSEEHRRKCEETRAVYRSMAGRQLADKIAFIDTRISQLLKDEEYSISTDDLIGIGKLVVQERTGLVVSEGTTFENVVRNPYIE